MGFKKIARPGQTCPLTPTRRYALTPIHSLPRRLGRAPPYQTSPGRKGKTGIGYRNADAVRFIPLPEFAVVKMKRIEVSVSSCGDALNEPPKARRWDRNPFRGLDFFDFEDALVFHGRTEAVGEVLDALKKQAAAKRPFVLVLGASGSGKSSLVRAGVLPRLTEVGAVDGHWPWRRALTRPGAGGAKGDPFDALAATLLDESALPELRISASPHEVRNLATVLRTHPDSAAFRIRHALDHLREPKFDQLPDEQGRDLPLTTRGVGVEPARQERRGGAEPKAHLALVVDQLEELFTGGFPLELQQGYLAALGALVRCERVFIIAALRSDFSANYQQLAKLADLPDLSTGSDLQAPTSDKVREMIRLPAESAGLRFETDSATGQSLDEGLLEAVPLTPEPLPVLEHLLSQLYLKQLERKDNLLRWSDYRALGELKEALANHAETVFSALKPEEQGALESVMRHLVTLGPTAEGVPDCRTVPYRDLISSPQFDDCQMSGARGLVDRLIKEGLLRAETGPGQELVVSLTHETLLRRWPRVAQWLSEDQDFLRKRDRLDASRKRWISKGCQTDHLLSPRNGLGEAKKLVRRFGPSLIQAQIDYIQKSRAYWKKRRRVRYAIGLAVLAGLALLATVAAAIWPNAQILRELANESAKLERTITDLAKKAPSPPESQLKQPEEEKPQAVHENADLAASQRSALQAQLTATETKALTARKDAELATSQRDVLQTQLKATEVKAQQAQKDAQLAASQRDALQARLTDTQAKAEQTRKSGDLAASQHDALAAQLKESEAKAQQAQKNGDLVVSQRDALAAQLKESEARAQQAQKNGELAASQRDALAAQLKESEAKAQQARKNGELVASQRDTLQAQLKESEARAQQAQKNGDLVASQRDALAAQLKESEARAQQAQKNGDLVAGQRETLQAQLKESEARAQQAQKNGELVASERDTLQAQLKESEAKAQQAQKSGDLAASQRDALAAQLKESEAKAQQAQKNTELASSQRDALRAQLKDTEANAQQAQKNAELASSQRDALQAQLKDTQANAQQARKNGELPTTQADGLQAQLKDTQAKAQQAQQNAELAASQRDALKTQLEQTEAKAQQTQKNGELAASQRDALAAQLKESEAKAQQAQKNAELASSQRDALQAQLKDTQANAQQARKNGELATTQADGLQAQLKDMQAKAQQAQQNAELAASQRDVAQNQLKNVQAKVQQAQNDAALAGSQRDALQARLKDTEARAQQAEKNAELVASQREALQAQLRETEAKAQQVQKNPEQMQPANSGLNAEGSTLTQPPDSSVQSARATPPIAGFANSAPPAPSAASTQPLHSSVQRLQTTTIPDLVSVGFPADPEARIEENEPPGPQPTPLTASVEPTPAGTQANESADDAGDQAAVKRFVVEYIRAVTSDDTSTQEQFFAHRVNFYGEGVLSLEGVQASTERYRREWPVRDWEPQGEPQILNTGNPRRYEVLQPFTWKVSNGARQEEGSATLYVRVWKNTKGEFHIVHVEQRSADLAADRPASQESQPPNAGHNTERRRRHSH